MFILGTVECAEHGQHPNGRTNINFVFLAVRKGSDTKYFKAVYWYHWTNSISLVGHWFGFEWLPRQRVQNSLFSSKE